ncbi:MAG: META domain-containing protein [Gammaproteobacteria bacterium]|nr:META domain-containing protein [Gammaproteobacteria bacterium]NNJ98464.1 META domain-containing protein [Gammaproteobacteria bacterium]
MYRGLSNKASVLIFGTILWIAGIMPVSLVAGVEKSESKPAIHSAALASDNTAPVATGSTTDNPLAGTSWRLLAFESMDDAVGLVRPDDPSSYIMRLNRDGTVTMRLNCNFASGTWSAESSDNGESGRFEFGPLAATGAPCSPPSMGQSIAALAKFIRSYVLRDGKLYLSLMADGGIYAWQADHGEPTIAGVPAAPEDGGPRNWEITNISGKLNVRELPSTTARIVAAYKPGTLLDNTMGCGRTEGRIWCEVEQLGGGPRGYVAAEFLTPALSPDGTAATGPDDSALRAVQGRFDAYGTIPCAQALDQPMMQCEFGVARAGGGYATVVVNKPGGRSRAIYFRMGKPIGSDTGRAQKNSKFRASREKDQYIIRIGNERYEIPEAVVLGS